MNKNCQENKAISRRQILASGATAAALGLAAGFSASACAQMTDTNSKSNDAPKGSAPVSASPVSASPSSASPSSATPSSAPQNKKNATLGTTIVGALSGRNIFIPDVNSPPAVQFSQLAQDAQGNGPADIGLPNLQPSYPDALSFQRKIGVLIPSANTIVEPELWEILCANRGAFEGIGIHISNISIPKPQLQTAQDLQVFKEQILVGLKSTVAQAMSAQPQYLIMGMSLEHILSDIHEIRALMANVETDSGLSCSTWHDAAPAALKKFNAKRIGMITPFDSNGNANAKKIFESLGFQVVAQYGFACANAIDIAHVPDWAKERALMIMLNNKSHQLDAIIQCGTNLSMNRVIEKVQPISAIPILAINATLLWHALRENGFTAAASGAGRLLKQF